MSVFDLQFLDPENHPVKSVCAFDLQLSSPVKSVCAFDLQFILPGCT
jgi:hypothetical protein